VLVQTKAIDVLTTSVFGWIQPFIGLSWLSTQALYWAAFAYHIVIGNEVAMLATSIPPLMMYAKQHSIDPLALGMIWTFGSGAKLFIYESGVLVVGYSYGYFDNRDVLKVGAILSVVSAILLLVLVSWYWPLIGIGR
jgi:sodium-dependent dicarboxylate transporter 2/3/5